MHPAPPVTLAHLQFHHTSSLGSPLFLASSDSRYSLEYFFATVLWAFVTTHTLGVTAFAATIFRQFVDFPVKFWSIGKLNLLLDEVLGCLLLYTLFMFHIKSWNLLTPSHWVDRFLSQLNSEYFKANNSQDHQSRTIFSHLLSQFFSKFLFWYVRLQVVQLFVFLGTFVVTFFVSYCGNGCSQTRISWIVAGTVIRV